VVDIYQQNYGAAREKYQKAMDIWQKMGNRGGEAATWHGLATIDVEQEDYAAAREKFQKAMNILEEIGDRYGQGATWYQLGILAEKLGRLAEGARLVALCFLIDQSIGHGDVEKDLRNLAGMAVKLGYTPEQLQALLREVAQAYQKDRGQGLLAAAFG